MESHSKTNHFKIVETEDGSSTLFSDLFKEHYHSIHGAVQESLHVFIRAGFDEVVKANQNVSVLEIGFGTGLNALLTMQAAEDNGVRVYYNSWEKYPPQLAILRLLNYPEFLENENANQNWRAICDAPWNEKSELNSQFSIEKRLGDILDWNPTIDNYFHLVYFDAFGFEVQPEMWSSSQFEKIWKVMMPGGCLVTYAARGVLKRTLLNIGFKVEKLPGAPGKREMMRAFK